MVVKGRQEIRMSGHTTVNRDIYATTTDEVVKRGGFAQDPINNDKWQWFLTRPASPAAHSEAMHVVVQHRMLYCTVCGPKVAC